MAKIFRDPLGQEWYAVQIGPGSVQIGEGDFIIFNEENGFQVILGHIFLEQFHQLAKPNDLNFPEVIILNEK
jgi:hypothetical protein